MSLPIINYQTNGKEVYVATVIKLQHAHLLE